MKKYLVLIMILSLFNISAYADDAVKSAIPEQDESYGFISAISDAEEFIPWDVQTVTRENFISAAVAAFGCRMEFGKTADFTDIFPTDKTYSYISTAVYYEFISNGSELRAKDEITLNECLKICISAAGYEDKANALGGYPVGYLSVAQNIGLLKGVGSKITAQSAYRLLFNTLNTDSLYQTGFGETTRYSKAKNEKLYHKIYNISKIKGIVNANAYTRMGDADGKAGKNKIEIEGICYDAEKDFNDFIGQTVTAYYYDESETSDKEIVYIHSETENLLTVAAEDTSYSNYTAEYTSEEKTKKIKLKRSFEYIFNGKVFNGYTDDSFVPECGEITFIDNDGDEIYDVANVKSYTYMKAAAVDVLKAAIYDEEDTSKVLRLNPGECDYTIYDMKEKSRKELFEVQTDSFLAVMASMDNRLINITICQDRVMGVVTKIDKEDGKIFIEDKEYKLGANIRDKKIFVGTEYTGFLGMYGEIAGINSRTGKMKYAYITKARLESELSDTVVVRMFTQNGDFETRRCIKNVKLDGKSSTAAQTLEKINGPQLIKYALNSDGLISKIDVAKGTTDLEETSGVSNDDALLRFDFPKPYNYRQGMFYPYFNIGEAIIFKVSPDVTDEENFSIGHSFRDGNYNNVTAYDVGLNGSAKVILFEEGEEQLGLTETAQMMLVEKMVYSINDEGEQMRHISGWQNGAFVEYFIDNSVSISKNGMEKELSGGDIIRFVQNGGVIKKLIVDFVGSELEKNSGTDAPYNSVSSILQYQAGKVYSVKNGYVYLSGAKNADGRYDFSTVNLKNVKLPGAIALYNVKSGIIRPGSEADIKAYRSAGDNASYIVVEQHYMFSNFAVIYDLS